MKKIAKVHIGVDISKNNLDIHIYPLGRAFRIDNSEAAIKKLIKEIAQYDVAQIACEATGGYEKRLNWSLRKSNYTLWVIDPRRVKAFIVASGCKSKNDKIDAKKIAEFASQNTPAYTAINRSESQEQLQALVNRKNDYIRVLAAEKARLKSPSHVYNTADIKESIELLEAKIKSIELGIQTLIQKDEKLTAKAIILKSVPGLGKAAVATILAFLPEAGELNDKEIAALVGVCPYDNDSGSYKGKRFIRGGRKIIRDILYMCALTTIKYHLPLKQFYDQLRAAKKPFKVAIVAVMRKLIIIANALLKKGELCLP